MPQDWRLLMRRHGGGHGWQVQVTLGQHFTGKIFAGYSQQPPAWLDSCQPIIRQASPFGKRPEEGALLLREDLGEERETDKQGTLYSPSPFKPASGALAVFLLFVSCCHSPVFEQWRRQLSCLNDFTGYYSDTQLLTFQFCHSVSTQKVHFYSIMFSELCQWAVMAFNIKLIINNYIIWGIISTPAFCVIMTL